MYLIELKLEYDDHKTRIYPGDAFGHSTLERGYSKLKFINIDVVANVDNRFYEISCIYVFNDSHISKNVFKISNVKVVIVTLAVLVDVGYEPKAVRCWGKYAYLKTTLNTADKLAWIIT